MGLQNAQPAGRNIVIGPGVDGTENGGVFTRASAAGYWDGALWRDVGIDIPRFDHLYAGVSGWLYEKGNTNTLLHNCDQSNVAWVSINSTKGNNVDTGPDGAVEMDSIIEDATAGVIHGVEQAVAVVAASVYSFNVFLKADGRDYVCLKLGSTTQKTYAHLSGDGAITLDAGAVGEIHRLGDTDIYWMNMLFVSPATGADTVQILSSTDGTAGSEVHAGDSAQAIKWWGAQFEANTPSSMIRTTTLPVARAQDLMTYDYLAADWRSVNDISVACEFVLLDLPGLPSLGSVIQTFPTGPATDNFIVYWDSTRIVMFVTDAANNVYAYALAPAVAPTYGSRCNFKADHVGAVNASLAGSWNEVSTIGTVPGGAGSNIMTNDPDYITIGSASLPSSIKICSLLVGDIRA